MHQLTRLLLILTVIVLIYCAVLVAILWPVTCGLLGAAVVFRGVQTGRKFLTLLGSARWASERELDRAGMLDAKSGLLLGRLPRKGR